MHEYLQRDIQWLNVLLEQAAATPDEIEQVRDAARAHIKGLQAQSADSRPLRSLDESTIQRLLKHLTIRFHLRNKAEQVHIARINRSRECSSRAPRAESIRDAIQRLHKAGKSYEEVVEILAGLDIQPTLTAHPTETRRRSILLKQRRLGACLEMLDDPARTPLELSRNESNARQGLSLLLATDEIRAQRLSVVDEVRNGLHHLEEVIWHAVPLIHRDIADSLEETFGKRTELPPIVRYRSWIGGDRDGNPFVTAEMTRQTLDMLAESARELWITSLEFLRRELSVSERRVDTGEELRVNLANELAEHPISAESIRHYEREPLRVKLIHMRERVRSDETYTGAALAEDLQLLQRALVHAGLDEVATQGRITDLVVQARAFGLHMAALDIRQHSRVHSAAIDEMFKVAGVSADYESLDEQARLALLHKELASDRPLLSLRAELSKDTSELLAVYRLLAETIRTRPESIGSSIISMTHERSHLLEVLVLMREVGLYRHTPEGVESDLDISPLFETVDDLERSASLMRELFEDPIYSKHLAARGGLQEIMLGYSDSNKDGGYWMANWRLHVAQRELAIACKDASVDLRFFHGRGGTVARGGGRAHRAILSAPPEARGGRLRFTEQGEVITFRYAHTALARRHLEQIVNATVLAVGGAGDSGGEVASKQEVADTSAEMAPLMKQLSTTSMQAYRSLVEAPGFWDWFLDASPVRSIGALPIASRPVSRAGKAVTFETIRAIPWVFSWTQMRANVPGWYGLGSAFLAHVLEDAARLAQCKKAYATGTFFATFIDNAQQEMARTRLEIARAYGLDGASAVHQAIASEFELATRAVLAITGQAALLDNNPVIQQSIQQRNPDTDLINALQIELLHRCRETTGEQEQAALQSLVLLSVNGLAAAMQSTG